MRRRLMSLLFALLLAFSFSAAAFGGQSQGDPQAKPRSLRVMTYNIHHGSGNIECTDVPGGPDCELDLDAIADVIRAHDPDIVGLQEVDRFWRRSGTVDQPLYLAEVLGMHYCYGANLVHPPDSHSAVPHEYGTAILSRFPILDCENTLLPRVDATTEQRGLLQAFINVRGVPLHFNNTHLQHTSDVERTVQAARVAELISPVDEPTVIVGDLNADPPEPSLDPIEALLRDVWLLAGVGDGLTAFVDEEELTRRIDYVWVSEDITAQDTYVAIDAVTTLASDHYPVVADIALPGWAVGLGPKR